MPSGLTSTFNNNQLLIGGTPNTGPGTYTYQVAIYDVPPSGQASSLISVGGTISIVASSTLAPACTISGTLASGPQTQTVTQTNAISNVTWQFTQNNCGTDPSSANASGLPPGVTMTFNNSANL